VENTKFTDASQEHPGDVALLVIVGSDIVLNKKDREREVKRLRVQTAEKRS